MRKTFDAGEAVHLYVDAAADVCEECGHPLWVCDHRSRFVRRLDGVYCLVRRDKWCPIDSCPERHVTIRPHVDLRFALPRLDFGLDVVLEIGERHLRLKDSLRAIYRDLNRRGVAIGQRTVCRMFRHFVALTKVARGDDEELRKRLRAQGGIVLMVDGVQFDGNSPVLYLVWDAISGEPLFGERKTFRSADDLVPLLERVKALDVPVVGVVSDKEKGLVPAIAAVFPDVPHQLCQTHFLKNCALGMKDDLTKLGQGVARRAELVRKIAKKLHVKGTDSVESEVSSPSDASLAGESIPQGPREPDSGGVGVEKASDSDGSCDTPAVSESQIAAELCAMARHASRASGKAPLNPPEHVRHQQLNAVHSTVKAALKKKGGSTRR